MNCLRCNTANDDAARFCKNCGADLAYAPATANEATNNSIVYLLVLMGWEYFTYLVWFIINKAVIPLGHVSRITQVYKFTGLMLDSISLLLVVLFAVLVRNQTVRICLIVFGVIRLGILLVYRVF